MVASSKTTSFAVIGLVVVVVAFVLFMVMVVVVVVVCVVFAEVAGLIVWSALIVVFVDNVVGFDILSCFVVIETVDDFVASISLVDGKEICLNVTGFVVVDHLLLVVTGFRIVDILAVESVVVILVVVA